MITKKSNMKVVDKSSFKGLVNYITSSQSKTERVGEITITNCHSDTVEWATLEIEAVQKMNTRAKSDKTYHLLISFPDGEYPPKEILKDIETEMCNALGFSEHQRISVVHRDTDNLHLHIAVNKIHPQKITIFEPKADYKIMGKKCEELELKHNLQKTNHAPKKCQAEQVAANIESQSGEKTFLSWMIEEHSENLIDCSSWKEMDGYLDNIGVEILPRGNGFVFKDTFNDIAIKASSVDRLLSKNNLEKRLDGKRKVKTPKRNNLVRFLTTPQKRKDLSLASSWSEFNNILKNEGLEIRLKGNGCILADMATGESVKASSVDRSFSKFRLELKFGPFKKNKQSKKKGSFTKNQFLGDEKTALYEEYLAAKNQAIEVKSNEFLRIDQERSSAIDRAKRLAKTKRAAIKFMKVSGIQRRLLYAVVSRDLKKNIESFNKKSNKQKKDILDVNRGLRWYNWLEQEAVKGNGEAITALRKRRSVKVSGDFVKGIQKRKNVLLDEERINSVTKNGTITYKLPSCVIRDYGEIIKITDGSNDKAIKELLEISLKKFGSKIQVNGSDAFKTQVMRVVVKEKIKVTFRDKKMETKRMKALNKGRGGRK